MIIKTFLITICIVCTQCIKYLFEVARYELRYLQEISYHIDMAVNDCVQTFDNIQYICDYITDKVKIITSNLIKIQLK